MTLVAPDAAGKSGGKRRRREIVTGERSQTLVSRGALSRPGLESLIAS